MAYLYITTSEDRLIGPMVDELVGDRLAVTSQIRVFSMHPDSLPPVAAKTIRYRPPAANMVYGALIGLSLGLLIGLLLMLAGFGAIPVLVLMVALAVGGALSRLWFGHGLAGELYRLDDAMRHGNTVMVVDVDRNRVAEIETNVKQRHPEVAVLGTDAEGTPPFP